MTFNEIAYNILNLVRAGRSSQDEHISLRQIKFNILHYRAMFIRRDYARNGKLTRHLEQDLKCIDVELADVSRCCSGFSTGIPIVKTINPIPRTVRLNFKEAITFVGAIDGLTPIQLIEPNMAKYASYAKYTGQEKKAFMLEDHMYFLNSAELTKVNVRGVFEDPRELTNFDCDGSPCYDDNTIFPLPADMLSVITAGLVEGELQLLAGSINDTLGDRAQDKPIPPPQQQQG